MDSTRNVMVAATQMTCIWDEKANSERAEGLVRQEKGADLVLIHEFFALAHPLRAIR